MISIDAFVDGVLQYDVAQPFSFPGGEQDLKWNSWIGVDNPVTWVVDLRGASAEELMTAGMVADIACTDFQNSVLFLPYLPAARADKGKPRGAWVYSEIINALRFDSVVVLDPHSGYMTELVNDCHELPFEPFLESAVDLSGSSINAVIAPDEGAMERATRAAEVLAVDLYQAEKKRDFDTGKILSYAAPDLPKHGRYLVVDDICDGGATFKILAESVGLSREKLSLWVTHGIFSGEPYSLQKSYSHIMTTDSHPGCFRVGYTTSIMPVRAAMLDYVQKELL